MVQKYKQKKFENYWSVDDIVPIEGLFVDKNLSGGYIVRLVKYKENFDEKEKIEYNLGVRYILIQKSYREVIDFGNTYFISRGNTNLTRLILDGKYIL